MFYFSSGSHDSGTFDLKKTSPCAPDAPDAVKCLVNTPVIGAAAKSVCHAWSVCQTMDFTQQLCQGIRYFDLRIAKKENCDNFYFVHALYGPEVNLSTVHFADSIDFHFSFVFFVVFFLIFLFT